MNPETTTIPEASPSNEPESLSRNARLWFIFTMLFLVVDYGRPQDILPFLRLIKPGLLMVMILTFFLLWQGKLGRSNSKQTRMIWLFVMLLAVYVPLAVNNFLAYHAFRTMILFMPFILSVVICVDSMKNLRTMILVCLAITAYVSIYSLRHHGMGSGNYFSDENDLSLYINMWLPFYFYLFFYEKIWWKKLIFAAGMLIGLMAVVVSFSRGGFVGLVAMTAVLWLYSHRKVLSAVIIVLATLFLFAYGSQEYWEEMSTVTDTQEGTAENRILSWKTAWDMFLDNPLGVGGNNFQVRFPQYQGDRFSRGMWGRVAHSLWFTLLPETGIIGTIIFFMLLRYNIRDIFYIRRAHSSQDDPDSRYLHHLALAMIASLAGFFASATFLSVLYYPHYWYMTAIIVAAANIAKTRASAARPAESEMLPQAAAGNVNV